MAHWGSVEAVKLSAARKKKLLFRHLLPGVTERVDLFSPCESVCVCVCFIIVKCTIKAVLSTLAAVCGQILSAALQLFKIPP